MREQTRVSLISLLLALPLLTACPMKHTPRVVNEPKREWTPQDTPVDSSVEAKSFHTFNVQGAYVALSDGNGSLITRVLKPLSAFVLNGKFIEKAEFRTPRMTQMIQVFNTAFLTLLEAKDQSKEFLEIKNAFYSTVFAGCSRDLKSDCFNSDLFSVDTRHTRIMTALARELDPKIEAAIKIAGTSKKCVQSHPECRQLMEERYRMLAMGVYKRNRYDDSDFAFTYMKYARAFAELMEYFNSDEGKAEAAKLALNNRGNMRTSYLAESHAPIFETLIAKYQPKDLKDSEFRDFVENFNPWKYSNKTADMFQRGSRTMFGYAARCCLYQDDSKTKLSPAVTSAIFEAQENGDTMGKSFLQMIMEIKKEHSYRLFSNLGILELVRQIEHPDKQFYNEFFFVTDRLFRGHLTTQEVEMVLANANHARVQKELPKMVSIYIRVQIAYMVLETNRFMASIYNSDIASNEVFEQAVTRSRELTGRWHSIQAQIDLLDRMMGSYFKGTFATAEYYDTNRLIKSVNRNIHYLSVFPNMIVMNYFLSKMKGKIVVNSWWGSFEIDADKILDGFFDGDIPSPWFRFGKDSEMVRRPMLLYAFEYLLSTEALNSFAAKDSTTAGSERTKFFDLVFNKYLDDNLDDLRSKITEYGRETWGDPRAASMTEVCNYETGATTAPPRIEISFLDLSRYTYAGIGDNGSHAVLSGLVQKAGGIIDTIRDRVEFRSAYTKVMLDIIEADLIRSGKITEAGQPHADTARLRANLTELERMRVQLAQMFLENHKKYFKCLIAVREVERRRANRLYEEERAYLGRVYDLMAPLATATNADEINARAAVANEKLAAMSKVYLEGAKLNFNFDSIDPTTKTYKMSKYNLLMRIKKHLEKDIFFTSPTADEQSVYGASFAEFSKSRPVAIDIPDGLVRENLISQGTSATLYWRDTKQAFVSQGMVAFNGKSGSYVEWRAQLATTSSLRNYVNSLSLFYLNGPIGKGQPGQAWEITKEDLVDAYIKALAMESMDDFDLANAKDFGVDGLQPKAFFEGKLFEKDFSTRLPLFYDLMKTVYSNAALSLETGPIFNALDFAQTMNNLQPFVFEPLKTIPASVERVYGEVAHSRLSRVGDLFTHLTKLENRQSDAAVLDERLTRPFFVDGTRAVQWYVRGEKNLVDVQKREDLKALVKEFTARTGDFYKTREKVKVP